MELADQTMARIVVPAHNEEAVIARCLRSLLDDSSASDIQIVVVCNGCTDATGQIVKDMAAANPHHQLTLLNVPEPSKVMAINHGLAFFGQGPVIILDADVTLTSAAALSLSERLSHPEIRAASTRLDLDTRHSSLLARSYHRFWLELPSIRDGLAGRGVYGLDDAALDRFDRRLPPVVADDRFVDLLFVHDERAIIDASSTVVASRGIRELVERKVRVFAGNSEVEAIALPQEVNRKPDWMRVVQQNRRRLVDLPAYLGVNLAAKLMARRAGRLGSLRWGTDRGSRQAT